mgnify:CR=1 FL=1
MPVRVTDMKPRPQRPLLTAVLLLASLQAWAADPLEQDTISIEGNRGLPKTIYIAPWKRVDEPLEGAEFETGPRHDPVPVERELLQRELELHREGYSVE